MPCGLSCQGMFFVAGAIILKLLIHLSRERPSRAHAFLTGFDQLKAIPRNLGDARTAPLLPSAEYA